LGFSNAPGAPGTIYGSLFFPWTTPVPLTVGQRVCVDLETNLLENDYMWCWETHIESNVEVSDASTSFKQSQLDGAVLSPAKLRRSASDYVPHLSEEGRLYYRALELMDGNTPLGSVARRLAAEFPQRFARWELALSYAAKISQEHA